MFKAALKTTSFALVLAFAPVAGATQNVNSLEEVVQVSVLPGWRMDNGHHMAAIQIMLAEGWKTYWRAPGEAGIPPSFAWGASRNLGSVALRWPTPTVFDQNGLQSIGYSGVVTIPIELTPTKPGAQAIVLRGEMELGVCQDICIPVSVRLDAELTAPGKPDPVIRASLKKRPATSKEAGVRSVICTVEPISDGLRMTTRIDVPRFGQDETVVVELNDQSVWVSQAIVRRTGGRLVITSELVPPAAAPFLLDRSDVRITILGDQRAADIRGCAAN